MAEIDLDERIGDYCWWRLELNDGSDEIWFNFDTLEGVIQYVEGDYHTFKIKRFRPFRMATTADKQEIEISGYPGDPGWNCVRYDRDR